MSNPELLEQIAMVAAEADRSYPHDYVVYVAPFAPGVPVRAHAPLSSIPGPFSEMARLQWRDGGVCVRAFAHNDVYLFGLVLKDEAFTNLQKRTGGVKGKKGSLRVLKHDVASTEDATCGVTFTAVTSLEESRQAGERWLSVFVATNVACGAGSASALSGVCTE